MESVGDTAYANVFGGTDTEYFFAVFIDELLKRSEEDPSLLLARSLAATITRVLELVRVHANGAVSKLNVAVSDGREAVISRYMEGGSDPPTLYYPRARTRTLTNGNDGFFMKLSYLFLM